MSRNQNRTRPLVAAAVFPLLALITVPVYANQTVKKVHGTDEGALKACEKAETMADVYRPRGSRLIGLGDCSCLQMDETYWVCERKATYEDD